MVVVLLIPLLVLAMLQGVLEFMPVSSEGQLLLVAVNIYGIDPGIALSVTFWLHLGTAGSVLIFYRSDIFNPLYKRLTSSAPTKGIGMLEEKEGDGGLFGPLFRFVVAGTVGTAIVAVPLYLLLRTSISMMAGEAVTALIGVLLVVTGVVLYIQRGAGGTRVLGDIPLWEALLVGLIQGVAVLPGISRSGVTLTWLLVRGVDREEALRLSFLMSVPATVGVVGLDLVMGEIFWAEITVLLLITLFALIVGLMSLAGLRYTARHVPFWAFCLFLGLLVLIIEVPVLLIPPVISMP